MTGNIGTGNAVQRRCEGTLYYDTKDTVRVEKRRSGNEPTSQA